MASPSSLLSEEQFLCSICLDVFASPVSLPCGHNFCQACIGGYWDSGGVCQCPLCKKTFPLRPDLSVNRFIEEMAEQFRRTRLDRADGGAAGPGEVPCDVCAAEKLRAAKSCLVCLASYCDEHIQPHYQGAAFRTHRLTEPVSHLKHKLCKRHERLLELFCTTDRTCICQFCAESDHRTHSIVPLEEECRARKTELRKTEAEVRQMIQDRLMKVEEIKQAVELSKSCAQAEIEDSVDVFTALRNSVERSQGELIELIEEKQRAAERRAEGIIQELEQEIAELKRRNTELEQLCHTEDHLHFLRRFPSLSSPPQAKDWSDVTVHSDPCPGAVSRAVCRLADSFSEEAKKFSALELKAVQRHAVAVSLDPDTAGPWLSLSPDGTQVRLSDTPRDLPPRPERFDSCLSVLGWPGFAGGRCYWEVEVGGKTGWTLGVARESVDRKGKVSLSPRKGYWTVGLRNGDELRALAGQPIPLPLSPKPRKVGVYVDYERGQVSFYNVEASSHIYTFTASFTEILYPYFSPRMNQDGTNSAPLILSPVRHAD